MLESDTIAAIATPAGMSGVGIIRVSGSLALDISKKITGKKLTPRYAYYSSFFAKDNRVIDKGVVIYFNSPNSFTGEDIVEFQGHGGSYVMQSVFRLILSHGARQAKPGEFTERAFLNNKIDLLQAEAIADLIESRSESASKAAMNSLTGHFSLIINKLQESVINLRVYVEAALDFSDEEIDFISEGNIEKQINELLKKIRKTKTNANYGKLLHDGIIVVLVGEPNAGKSSLLNKLLGHERAIVTDEAGTTRDTLEETIIIKGVPVKITDTAGLRDTKNLVEKAGIERTKNAINSATLAIWLRDIRDISDNKPKELNNIDYIEVHNKSDLITENNKAVGHLRISAKTGDGIEKLFQLIADKIDKEHSEETVFSARERHIEALNTTEKHINNALCFVKNISTSELVAEELRLAQESLSVITGEYRTDDLLGDIFSNFCIGK